MVGHEGSSAGSYLADPTSPIPSHCASVVATSALVHSPTDTALKHLIALSLCRLSTMGNFLSRIFTCSEKSIPRKTPPSSTPSSPRCSSCGNLNEEAPPLPDKHALKKGSCERLLDWRDSVCPCCRDDNEQYLTPTQKQLLNRKERRAVGRMEKYIKGMLLALCQEGYVFVFVC